MATESTDFKYATNPEISICIPTFNEEKYIVATLAELFKQNAVKSGRAEIIVADYDPDDNKGVLNAIEGMPVIYHPILGKGIAHARDSAIRLARGRYIVNFDADARFNVISAVDALVAPIKSGQAVFTCCDNQFPADEISPNSPQGVYLGGCCVIQRTTPVCVLEPGLSFGKADYFKVGGFDDVTWAEGLRLSQKFIWNHGAMKKTVVDGVVVFQSARRAKAFDKLGLGVFDYTKAIRGDDVLKT